MEMARGWNSREQQEVTALITEYIKKYFRGYLNTNIGIEEFRVIQNYAMS
jgi:hypothetical protein